MNAVRNGRLSIGFRVAVVLVALGSAEAFADPPPEQVEEWSKFWDIRVDITAPPNDTYVPINSPVGLTADVSDLDCGRVGDFWYLYNDDVTSGETAQDHHIVWSATTGTFTDEYGTVGRYLAPDFSPGPSVRNVTITATADDGGDAWGVDETAQSDSVTIKVWQVTVTVLQTGDASITNYDGPLETYLGGAHLGWVVPNSPAGSLCYDGNTLLMGSIPAAVPYRADYVWRNDKKGLKQYMTVTSSPGWIVQYNSATWQDDWATTGRPGSDGDPKHPNGTGTDVKEIFGHDAPGLQVGAANNWGIPAGWITCERNMEYEGYVELSGYTVSNRAPWSVEFTIEATTPWTGTWTPVGNHTP